MEKGPKGCGLLAVGYHVSFSMHQWIQHAGCGLWVIVYCSMTLVKVKVRLESHLNITMEALNSLILCTLEEGVLQKVYFDLAAEDEKEERQKKAQVICLDKTIYFLYLK